MAIHGHHSGTGRLEKAMANKTGPLQAPAEKMADKPANKGTKSLEADHAHLGGGSHALPSGLHLPPPKASGNPKGQVIDAQWGDALKGASSDSSS
ncbi:MAG TPA: hypothetical protein V6D47_03985 [Oscillatoriaceae cyanobacterium]